MTTATAPLNLPAAVVRLIREGAAELAHARVREQQEKEAKERAATAKENALFCSLVDFVTEILPEPILPFVDFGRDRFDYPHHTGHVCYIDLAGLTRIAFGLGVNDRDGRSVWHQGAAGFLVAIPQTWESDDDGHSVYVPSEWPMKSGSRAHGWNAYPTLSVALAHAREQFGKIEGLQTEAAAKQLDREERAAAREKSRADRKASLTPGEKLLEALAAYIRNESEAPDPRGKDDRDF